MRIAIIDLGTNSVRFDVHQIGRGKRARPLHREKLMIRLGQGVFISGKLDREAVRRTLDAFVSFARTAAQFRAEKIIAFGTSALREASDGDRLLEQIRKKTGIEVKVISGQEEARLIARGILANEKFAKGRFALVDIGGGSTEISICRAKEAFFSESFPLGTARLQQIFLKSSPPRGKDSQGRDAVDQLRAYIRSVLLPKMIAEGWPKVGRVIGSSGTIRALQKMVRKARNVKGVSREDLSEFVRRMSAMTTTQLLGIPGVEARRVDMILAGAILLEECMKSLGAKRVAFTDYSLRDGVLDEEMSLHRQKKASHLGFHLEDLREKARKFGSSENHFQQVAEISETLFDRLAKVHRLKPHWKTYLVAAAILHDVGEAVSPAFHEAHSYYIVKNADFPAMDKWETDFLAMLCLGHRGGKVDFKAADFFKNKLKKQAFLRILALLRIADSLDRGHKNAVQEIGIRVEKKRVVIKLKGKSSVDLELLRLEQKKQLFEEVFKRALVIEAQSS